MNAEPRTDFGAIPGSVWDVSGKWTEEKSEAEGKTEVKAEDVKPAERKNGEENPVKGEAGEKGETSRSEVVEKKPMSKVVPRNLCN